MSVSRKRLSPAGRCFLRRRCPLGGCGVPLLAENHLGRPTKLEGNPEHPASLGAADVLAQASVLGLYDPDRSRTIVHRGDVKTWSSFTAIVQAAVNAQRGIQGQGLRILTEPISSPSLLDQIHTLLADFPAAKWHQWDAVYGVTQGAAPAERATSTASIGPTSSCRSTPTSSASDRRPSATRRISRAAGGSTRRRTSSTASTWSSRCRRSRAPRRSTG